MRLVKVWRDEKPFKNRIRWFEETIEGRIKIEETTKEGMKRYWYTKEQKEEAEMRWVVFKIVFGKKNLPINRAQIERLKEKAMG